MNILFVLLMSVSSWAYSPWQDFKDGSKEVISQDTKWLWITGSAATLVALNYDHSIRNHFDHHEKEKFYNSIGDVMGTGLPGVGIGLITLGVGVWGPNEKALRDGTAHLEALASTLIYTSTLKIAVDRDRPYDMVKGKDTKRTSASFPSGHTSTAFATTAVMMESYGPTVGIPTLILAGMTGYSRIQRQVHYLSDVLFGATLGYATGMAFTKIHKPEKNKGISWNVMPYFDSFDSLGAVASASF